MSEMNGWPPDEVRVYAERIAKAEAQIQEVRDWADRTGHYAPGSLTDWQRGFLAARAEVRHNLRLWELRNDMDGKCLAAEVEALRAQVQRVRELCGDLATPAVAGDWMAGYSSARRDILRALDGGTDE